MKIDLDLLSDAIPHQVAILDADRRFTYANAAYCMRIGLSPEQLVGKTLPEVVGQNAYAKFDPWVEQCLRGEAGCIEHTFPNRFEGRAWRTSFIPNSGGGCIMVSDDPGEQNGQAVRAQRTEERLQAFVDFAPIGMIFSHLDGRVLEANQAFLDLVEYDRVDLERGEIHWDKITPPEYLHFDFEAIAEAKDSGFSHTYEKEYITKSGNRVHVLIGFILVGPTRDEAVAFIVDITAQKHAEEEVRRLNAELEAFCYSVSHDLRAPLRSIDGFAFALFQDYENKLDSEGVDFIGRIRASAKRMDELISALLSLSRLTRVELEREDVNATELAQTIASDLRQQFPDRSLGIAIQPGLTIHADRRMLRVVLDNLMRNAVKFTAKVRTPQIEIGQTEASGPFFVRDNGVGFNMEESDKLFQPFERLHSPREFSGSGIGLATVQRIVRKHGGNIWAEAETGKGATFYFTL